MIGPIKYLSLFLWLIGAGAAYSVYASSGLPHVIWSYTFLDNGDQYNPYAKRYYTSCTFIGWYGAFTVPASNGRCGWVRFFKERG